MNLVLETYGVMEDGVRLQDNSAASEVETAAEAFVLRAIRRRRRPANLEG